MTHHVNAFKFCRNYSSRLPKLSLTQFTEHPVLRSFYGTVRIDALLLFPHRPAALATRPAASHHVHEHGHEHGHVVAIFDRNAGVVC
jgi:hypothetical protein